MLESITIKDFLSIGEATLNFRGSGLVLIDGFNHDDVSANGAGKTGIINAICYALYGKLPRKITVDEIARTGSKYPCVELKCSFGIVCRTKPTKVTVTGSDGAPVLNPQDYIHQQIGMTYEQFVLVACNPQNSVRFLEKSDADKKDFFIDILGLSDIDDYRKKIDIRLQSLVEKELAIKSSCVEIDAKISAFNSMMQTVPAKKDSRDIEEQIRAIDLTEPDLSRYDELEDNIRGMIVARQKADQCRQELISIEEALNEHVSAHGNERVTAKCPGCGMVFDSSLSKSHAETSPQSSHDRVVERLRSRQNKLNNLLIDTPAESLEELNAILKKCIAKKQQISKTFNENSILLNSLQRQLDAVLYHNKQIDAIEEKNAANLKKIAALELKKEQAQSQLNSILPDIDRLKQAKAIFSPTGLPAYILDSAVNIFNDRVGSYLSRAWPNAELFLSTYKENKNGDVRAKLSEALYNLGIERSISSLSGGEYRIVSLVVDMAIVDVYEYMLGVKVPWVAWDEPFNGLDEASRARLWPVISDFAEHHELWVIDHAVAMKSMFHDTIMIEKRNGVSSVV